VLEINPRFRAEIPNLLESICGAILATEDALDEAKEALAAMQEFLAFEIDKAKLRLEQLEWQTRASQAEVTATKAHLARLEAMRDGFTPEKAMSFFVFLEAARDALEGLEGHKKGAARASGPRKAPSTQTRRSRSVQTPIS
jgi:hypothetical protein